jgi:TolB-like protein
MSPEQISAKELDARTDLFSFGAILYEMATGQLPFRGQSSGLIFNSILEAQPVSPLRLNPDLPDNLEQIINKALEKDRDFRYQSAAEMTTDLQRMRRQLDSRKSGVLPKSSSTRRTRVLWACIGLLAVIALALISWRITHRNPIIQPGVSKAVAVLPFQNLNSDKETDFLRLALADEVATDLSRVQAFSVRPSASTTKYTRPELDLQQAGHEMGVTAIVTGHFQTEKDQLEITLEAVDVESNRTLWRDTVNVAASNRLAMREEVASKITHGLIAALGGAADAEQAQSAPRNQGAYDLYLRSIAYPHDVAPNKQAILMLERAVGIGPDYAPAWEALGQRYYFDATYGDGGQQTLKRADSAYERALALDPNLIFAASQLIGDRAEEAEVKNAYAEATALVKRWPQSAQAHFTLAYVSRYVGLLDESARECDLAQAKDGHNYQFRSCAMTFLQLGQTRRAMEFVRLDWGSEWAASRAALVLLQEGRLIEARQSIQQASSNLAWRDLFQACIDTSADLDRIAQATEAAVLQQPDSEGRYFLGRLMAYCGKKDSARRLLKRAIEQNYCAYMALQTDPLIATLRDTPDFAALLAESKQCQNTLLAQPNNGS